MPALTIQVYLALILGALFEEIASGHVGVVQRTPRRETNISRSVKRNGCWKFHSIFGIVPWIRDLIFVIMMMFCKIQFRYKQLRQNQSNCLCCLLYPAPNYFLQMFPTFTFPRLGINAHLGVLSEFLLIHWVPLTGHRYEKLRNFRKIHSNRYWPPQHRNNKGLTTY